MKRGRFELEADAQSGRYYLMAVHDDDRRRSGWGIRPEELGNLRKLIEWAEQRETARVTCKYHRDATRTTGKVLFCSDCDRLNRARKRTRP